MTTSIDPGCTLVEWGSPKNGYFGTLPLEVALEIFKNVPPDVLYNVFYRVSRSFREISDESSLWRYHFTAIFPKLAPPKLIGNIQLKVLEELDLRKKIASDTAQMEVILSKENIKDYTPKASLIEWANTYPFTTKMSLVLQTMPKELYTLELLKDKWLHLREFELIASKDTYTIFYHSDSFEDFFANHPQLERVILTLFVPSTIESLLITALSHCKEALKELDIAQDDLTDSFLNCVSSMNLESLKLCGTHKFSEQGLAKLKEAHPTLKIEINGLDQTATAV